MNQNNLAIDPAASEDWQRLGTVSQLFEEGACKGVKVGETRIGLFLVDGEVFAVDDLCTHGHAHLSEGFIEGHEVECPLHAGLFDVRSGKALSAPLVRDVRSHALRRDGDDLFIRLTR